MAALNPTLEIAQNEVEYWPLGQGRRIAYHHTKGYRQPTILYVPGFFAPMTLRKTLQLEKYAQENGYSNVRYDQECVGLSSGEQVIFNKKITVFENSEKILIFVGTRWQ